MLPLATNARAKMADQKYGFVKLFCPAGDRDRDRRRGGRTGRQRADPADRDRGAEPADREDLAHSFTVYPSLSGSITEAGRQLMRHGDLD